MATIEELQKRLDNKTFDPSTLTDEQRIAVNMAFEQGQLKGYSSVAEIERERDIGARLVAKEKEKRDRPFTVATQGMVPFTDEGIERSDLELTGDIGAAAYVYLKDAPKVVQAIIKDPQSGFGVDKVAAASQNFNKLEKLYSRLPYIRNVKVLSKSARALGKFVDGFRMLGARSSVLKGKNVGAMSQLLQTEIKAQAASAAGAGAGSILYDMANLATDFNVAAQQDLAEVSDNDIKKLPYADQVLVHSAEAMKNALMFNAIGSSIFPLLGVTMRGMKGILGLKGAPAKAMAEDAQKRGINLSISTLADTSTFGGKLVNGFGSTFGVFPLIGTFNKAQRKRVEKQTFNAFLDQVLAQAPLEHQAILSYNFLPTMKKNFEQFQNMIQRQYAVADILAEKMGNPRFIPTSNLKKVTQSFFGKIQASVPQALGGGEYGTGVLKDLTAFDDPFVQVIEKLRNLDDFITPTEYQGIVRTIMNASAKSRLSEFRPTFFDMVKGAKEDFYKVGNPDSIQGHLNSKAFADEYKNVLEASGKPAADEYVKKIQIGMKEFHDQLTQANHIFSQTTQAFNSPIARTIKNSDPNIFSVKGLMNISPEGRISPDKLWDNGIKQMFQATDGSSIRELRFLLGADKEGTVGKEVFNRARTLYLVDSFIKSFKKQPNMPSKPLFQRLEDARRLGVIEMKYVDDIYDMTGTRVREEIKSFNPEKSIRYGIGERPAIDLKMAAKDAGEFDIKSFRKNIGYETEADKLAAIDKWTEMYGGGAQGREAALNLKKLVDIIDKEYNTLIADTNKFVNRRFILGGLSAAVGAFAAGASMGPAGVIAFGLLAGGSGFILSNPKALKYLLDVYTDLERLQRAGKASSMDMPKSLYRLLNWAKQEDKDFPDVDPKKINFEEVTDYLYNKNILIPEIGFSPEAVNSQLKDRFYPELNQIKNSSETNLVKGVNFLQGNNKGINTAETVVNYQPPARQQSTPQAPVTGFQEPPYRTLVPDVYQPRIPAQAYQSLFPNDPLGQAIAQSQVTNAQ